MTQHEAVVKAMEANGGFATMGDLYQRILRLPHKWKSDTLANSIRRAVYENQDEKGKRLFFRIQNGLWGLLSERETVLAHLGLDAKLEPEIRHVATHAYYQGLVTELGNLRGFETYVPPQDRGQVYLHGKLSDVATIERIFEFTYPCIVKRAATVDGAWFNDHHLPDTFIEVEHSTDFQNSLGKFVDLRFFHVNFYIVAEAVKRERYTEIVRRDQFISVRDRVKFLSYERLVELYEAESRLAALQNI